MKLSTQILLGFLIAISIDLLDSYGNYRLTLKVNTDREFLLRSETLIRNSGNLNKGIIEMQSSFRGFLLTGDEDFLAAYYSGMRTLPGLIREEKSLANTPSQRQKLDSVLLLHEQWMNFASEIINEKKRSLNSASPDNQYERRFAAEFKARLGKDYDARITGLFTSFDQYEYRIREERRNILAASIKQTERFSLMFSILIIVVSAGIALFLVIKISRRIASLVKLAENISGGNFTNVIDDKNDELSSLSFSLNSMSDKLKLNISQLEKKNDELDQFAYVVSHDLKAPVRGISNVVSWIEEDLQDDISPKMREYLDIIPERIRRMESLIDGLLDYARISRDRSVKEEVDVAIMVKDLAELIVPKEFTFFAGDLPTLRTEKLLLQQVFSNLISNAVKYTPAKGGRIGVSCVDRQDYLEFSVSDNGPGIEEKYHEKIFIIFQTLREKHDKESTGVGLAIVKKVVEDKHGSIAVVSSPGNGSAFIFTWPKN